MKIQAWVNVKIRGVNVEIGFGNVKKGGKLCFE